MAPTIGEYLNRPRAADSEGLSTYEQMDRVGKRLKAEAREARREQQRAAGAVRPLPAFVHVQPSSRSDAYALAGVAEELARLDGCQSGGWGTAWDTTSYEVACNLIELANSPWNSLTREWAHEQFLAHAPSDGVFDDKHETKWHSALNTVGDKARPAPPGEPSAASDLTFRPPSSVVAAETVDAGPRRPALEFTTLGDLAARVDAAGPRTWLVRGVWPEGAYGVHGAEPKAGKTWNALDLAVAVASGTPWLGRFEVDLPGPVLVFTGEGGEGNVVRRLRAIAADHGVRAEELPITVCTRVPHLNDVGQVAELAQQLETSRPVLAIIDPLYLAARGGDGRDLYAMGALLEAAQHACDGVGAALVVVTHFNRQREVKGAARFTGAGPAEWGRVLIAAGLVSRHRDAATQATTVVTAFEVIGGEVPDREFRLVRRVAAIDPDDLDSPLTVTATVEEVDEAGPMPGGTDPADHRAQGLSPAACKLLEALRSLEVPVAIPELVDRVVKLHGHGLRRPTCSTELNHLAARGLVDRVDVGVGRPVLWAAVAEEGVSVSADTPADSADTPDGVTPSGVSPSLYGTPLADTLLLTPPGAVSA